MKRFTIIILVLAAALAQPLWAKDVKRPNSYNFLRGVELYDDDNYESAATYFEKELEQNPKNGYAHLYSGLLAEYNEDISQALQWAGTALKYLPKKDPEYVAYALLLRARCYEALEQDDKAIQDMEQAAALQPDMTRVHSQMAEFYYKRDEYAKSDASFQRLVELEPGDVFGYMGLARNANEQKNYGEALKQLNYVLKLDPTYHRGYTFRSEANFGIKKYNDAVDDLITALKIEPDLKAMVLLYALADSAFTPLSVKLKVQARKDPTNALWPQCLGMINMNQNHYQQAIESFKDALKIEDDDYSSSCLASCYHSLGDEKNALLAINKVIENDSTDYSALEMRSNIYDMLGDRQKALEDLNTIIADNPDADAPYINRAFLQYMYRNYDAAIDDFNTAMVFTDDSALVALNRGRVLMEMKRTDEAMADFRLAQSIYEAAEYNDSTMPTSMLYVYHFVGDDNRAAELINKMRASQPDDMSNTYEYACVYSLMGRTDDALQMLRRSLELGSRSFTHIDRDPDLVPLRNLPEYQALIKQYKEIHQNELACMGPDDGDFEYQTVEVPFTNEGKMCKVKCDINGLPLHFIFDTGASDVAMSSVEASFMLKNGYLTADDIVGKQNYMTASGEISEGTVVNLRNVNFGGLTLKDVRASITHHQAAPLLLGQSVLGKLGKIEIDNAAHVLRITHKVQH